MPVSPLYSKFLAKGFFEESLRDELKESEVLDVSLEAANRKGENYSSEMLRVRLQLKHPSNEISTRSFVIKLNPPGVTQDVMDQFNVFPKEIEMYTKVLPHFEDVYSAALGTPFKISPKCIKTRSSNDELGNFLLLQDLCESGFRTVNRVKGLDMKHMEVSLQTLAKFHAASVVYIEKVNRFNYCNENAG